MSLSSNAVKVYDFLKKKYIREGYCFSGSIPINTVMEVLGTFDFQEITPVLDELEEAGVIQKSENQAFAIQLAKKERKNLIVTHQLEEIWLKDPTGCTFDLKGEEGEITKAMEEEKKG